MKPIVFTAQIGDLLDRHDCVAFSRKDERLAAGLLAQRALAYAGAEEPFRRDEKELPLWPEGFCGSITHCCGEAAAAVRQGRPLGMDMEKISRVSEKIFARIATPQEKARIDEFPDAALYRALLFSGKEAAWKLLQVLAAPSPGWQDIDITLTAAGRISAQGCGFEMHGVYRLHKDKVIVLMEEKNEGTFPDPSWIAQ